MKILSVVGARLQLVKLAPIHVAEAIRGLPGDVTAIAVAHRLSTVRESALVQFMNGGIVTAQGTFDEVVASSVEFAAQVKLAGLA